jgi:hypothetical protein
MLSIHRFHKDTREVAAAPARQEDTMAKVEYRMTPANDRSFVRIETVVDGQSVAWSDSEAPDIEGIIELLAQMRAGLADEVPRERDPNIRGRVVRDPVWQPLKHRVLGGRLLALRHPGLGWLHFVFPEEEARKVAAALTEELPDDPSEDQSRNPPDA